MRSEAARSRGSRARHGGALAMAALLLAASCGKLLGLQDGTAQAACTTDAQCAPGYGCLQKLGCRNRCIADTDCGVGSRCFKAFVTTACIPVTEGCGSADPDSGATDDCPQGTSCDGAVCRTQCSTDDDCAGGQVCASGACVGTDPNHESAGGIAGGSGNGGSAGTDAGTEAGGTGAASGGGSGTAGMSSLAGAAGAEDMPACKTGQTRSCAEDGFKGNCGSGSEQCAADGTWGACNVSKKAADGCAVAGDDADCDGVPNEGCACVGTETRSCASDGLVGNCAKGTETCAAGQWGACSVTKQTSDSCTVAGDDANCNGTANEGCPCVTGATRPCGPQIAQGICKQGTQTCANETWGTCLNAVYAAARDCSSSADNDCDGKPDNTIDTMCTCAVGTTQACNTHPGHDGKGPCKAGSQKCVVGSVGTSAWNTCTGAVGPAGADTCDSGNDANCDGIANELCPCINGATKSCGNCNGGTETCVSGAWGACQNQPPALQTFYYDGDHDGFGDPNQSTQACSTTPPSGYASQAGDCCDYDPHAYAGSTWSDSAQRVVCGGWDYNCDGLNTDDTCAADDGCYCCDQFGNCGSADACWLNSEPGCGNSAPFGDNTTGAVGCSGSCGAFGSAVEVCN